MPIGVAPYVKMAVRQLGGLVAILDSAGATDRAELYEALGVGAKYDAATHIALLEVEPVSEGGLAA